MSLLAVQLVELTQRLVAEPWPIGEMDRQEWAHRIDLPVEGKPFQHPENTDPTAPAAFHSLFTVAGQTVHVSWHQDGQQQLRELSLVVIVTDPARFDDLHTTAVEVRDTLDRTWTRTGHDSNDTAWRAAWTSPHATIELYWDGPGSNDYCILHIAAEPAAATVPPGQ